jgi:hypothetical protein
MVWKAHQFFLILARVVLCNEQDYFWLRNTMRISRRFNEHFLLSQYCFFSGKEICACSRIRIYWSCIAEGIPTKEFLKYPMGLSLDQLKVETLLVVA